MLSGYAGCSRFRLSIPRDGRSMAEEFVSAADSALACRVRCVHLVREILVVKMAEFCLITPPIA